MQLKRKLAYSFGAIATALSFQAFSTYIIFFYVDIVKLPAQLAATAMLIYAVWNAINDPIAGYLSDHTRSKWGRRIPYIALGAVPFGLIYFLLWVPPFTDYNQIVPLFFYFLFFICLFDTFYTITVLNWSCLFPEMFASLKERTQVNAFRQMFAMVGLLLGIALPPLIYSTWGWSWLGAILGALATFSLFVALWGSHEEKEYSQERQLPLWQSFKITFENKSFLTFVFANLFVQLALTLILATVPFFTKYVLDLSPGKTAAILAIAFLVTIPMLFVWEFIANRWGAKKTFMAAMVLLLALLWPLFYVTSFWPIFTLAALLGVALAGFILVVDLLIADVIDEDELKTGNRREGIYFGVNAFITRLAIALEAVIMGLIFVSTGYSPYVHWQSQSFLNGLRFLIAGLPMIALFVALVIISFYPLAGKKKMKAIGSELHNIHHQKGLE